MRGYTVCHQLMHKLVSFHIRYAVSVSYGMVGRPGGPSAKIQTCSYYVDIQYCTVYGYLQVSVRLEYLLEILRDELMSDKQFLLIFVMVSP